MLKLAIGNKNYSSWSMRPWLALKGAGIDFEEINIPIYNGPEDKQRILDVTPSGKVPALVDGEVTVWDSLSIIEYLAERFPDAGLWPKDRSARAHARSVCAEMHSGFMPLRNECGMNIHRPVRAKQLSDDARQNVARIVDIWIDCRTRHSASGPFLFGGFGAADAMYAPVIHRLRTYDITVPPGPAKDYAQMMWDFAPFAQWTREALAETLVIARYEDI